MRIFKIIGPLVAVLLSIPAMSTFGQTKRPNLEKPFRPTGTYSNMYYNSEGGDGLGDEIKIVYTRSDYQGVLQFAEGEPEELVIVSVEINKTNVSFSVPNSSPYAGQFKGTVENGILKGEFQFKTGGIEKVELKKGKSYWD